MCGAGPRPVVWVSLPLVPRCSLAGPGLQPLTAPMEGTEAARHHIELPAHPSSFSTLKLMVSLTETTGCSGPLRQPLLRCCMSSGWTGFIFTGILGCKSGRDHCLCHLLGPSSDLMVQVSWGGHTQPCWGFCTLSSEGGQWHQRLSLNLSSI